MPDSPERRRQVSEGSNAIAKQQACLSDFSTQSLEVKAEFRIEFLSVLYWLI